MKRLMLIGAAICAIAIMPTLPANAMPLGSLKPAVSQADNDTILVGRGGRGEHRGWEGNRGHHYGWSRGRHRGWS
jgi:hypothetical protein